MLHYHCQSRKQIFNAAQSQYVSATVIGGANAQLSDRKGGWEGSFGQKFFFQKCGLVGRSVALWGEVWSIHCQGGGRQGRQAWWLWLRRTLQKLNVAMSTSLCKFNHAMTERPPNFRHCLFKVQGVQGILLFFVCGRFYGAHCVQHVLCCGVWIQIMREGNIDTLWILKGNFTAVGWRCVFEQRRP